MIVNFFKAAVQDTKATCYTKDFLPSKRFYPVETSLLVIEHNGKFRIVDFHGSRPDAKTQYAKTLYGEFTWPSDFPEIAVGKKTPMNVIDTFIYSSQQERNKKIQMINGLYAEKMFGYKEMVEPEFKVEYEAKPRPPAFPTDFLGNGLLEDKHEKVNPLDERMERLLVEIQSSLILAGGCHKAKHYDHSFKEVMRNLLSNVDKKTLVRIIENAY